MTGEREANERSRAVITASINGDEALVAELIAADPDPMLTLAAAVAHAHGMARRAAAGAEMDVAAYWRLICEQHS